MRDWKGYKRGVNLGGWLSQCNHTYEHYDSFIKENDIPTLVERALKEGNPGYPVPRIMNKKDCEEVIRSIMA